MSEPNQTHSPPARTVLLRNYYERDLPVDDVTGEATIRVRVRRFTHAQLMAFSEGWNRCENPPSARAIYRKADEADVPMDEVRRRRLDEMTPDVREAFEAAERAEGQAAAQFLVDNITAHVWVSPTDTLTIEDESGHATAVRTGEDLARVFAGNLEMLMQFARCVFEENTLGAQKKRILRSRSASTGSSIAPPTAAAGPAPAATAAPADSPGSASPVDASGHPAMPPSGLTA